MSTIKKSITSEKSFTHQEKGIWTFLVTSSASKHEIKSEIEKLFGVEVADVNTLRQRTKVRKMRGSRIHTRRAITKIARVRLTEKSKKIDLTKLSK